MTGPATPWAFRPSPPAFRIRIKRLACRLTRRRAPPRWRTIRPVTPAARWNVLFLYAPQGALDADQRRILARVRRLDGSLLVVLACPDIAHPVVPDGADAIIVKELSGFDFSAYRLALDAIAGASPGAVAYVQNDSVLGPFGDVDRLVRDAPWDLTGFIATRAVENHLSSFAFVLRDVTPARLAALTPILSSRWSCDDPTAVILLQETRLARVAARRMSVGAYWYVPTAPLREPIVRRVLARAGGRAAQIDTAGDATLACPVALLDAGFPYLKRSLFTKFAGLHAPVALKAALSAQDW
ncbi:hypothetical protein Q5H91_16335 [Sphingomonas sp. KR1UV-12]|uniref:Rhamnosyltransferase n=1 Tax=Sphingomonas aurea TaxID=3063994 RepID=A0ABT9EPN8_9SPHN|nr:hypothetical protein [Sphingomonas sp. KR1UV-12]MDP1028792.1 hypothetical protein [Sphingomonas sp. KR1UV-12]